MTALAYGWPTRLAVTAHLTENYNGEEEKDEEEDKDPLAVRTCSSESVAVLTRSALRFYARKVRCVVWKLVYLFCCVSIRKYVCLM